MHSPRVLLHSYTYICFITQMKVNGTCGEKWNWNSLNVEEWGGAGLILIWHFYMPFVVINEIFFHR